MATTQTEAAWIEEAMRLARACRFGSKAAYDALRAHLATRPDAPDVNALIRAANWLDAPERTQWGFGMMVADIEITKDETLTIYAHRDGIAAATGSTKL